MNLFGMVQIGASTVIFLLAATMAKQWALAPSMAKIVITLALYTLGNLIMLKLIRDFGLSISLSPTERTFPTDRTRSAVAAAASSSSPAWYRSRKVPVARESTFASRGAMSV